MLWDENMWTVPVYYIHQLVNKQGQKVIIASSRHGKMCVVTWSLARDHTVNISKHLIGP